MGRLSISFSGGRTSAYMTKRLLDLASPSDEIVVQFANTGQEHEETLRFVDRCDREFGFNVIWLEAVVNPEHGQGTGFKVVTFETAARNGEPFEASIQKYGIPNQTFQSCNREMKLRPMQAYLRSIGWGPGSYKTAVGIRADEMDRMSAYAKMNGVIYPLVAWKVRKADVRSWWAQQQFDLKLPEHWGNCKTCWKKSDRKLFTIAHEHPEWFGFFRRMEQTYPDHGAGDGNRRFFRGQRTTDEIIEQAHQQPFRPFCEDDELQIEMDMLDLGGGCGESCEVFADEMPMLEAAE